jgi:translation initiation factor 3 subunit B
LEVFFRRFSRPRLSVLDQAEHYRANAVEWDPSGRMVATCVTQPLEGMTYKFQMDNGYHLWTFQGELFAEKTHEKFYSLQWRPRPQCLLDAAAKKAVVKNLRKFERKFERADKEQKRARDLKQMVHQQRERNELRERLASRKARNYDALAAERAAARCGVDVDAADYWVVTSMVREVVVSVKEDVVGVL